MTQRDEALERADRWIQNLPPIYRIEKGTNREQTAVQLLHLSVEHHSGIVTLVQNEQFSPAFALMRPQQEAWLRAIWARSQATDNELKRFLDGSDKRGPSLKKIIDALADKEERAVLQANYDTVYHHLCDYTHGGANQIKARDHIEGVQTFFTDESIRWLVDSSARMSYLALMEMAEVIDDSQLLQFIHAHFLSVYPCPS
jgi:hypothetical protein